MTRGSFCTSAGVPSAILRPKSIATTLSEMPITIAMWCSTSSTVSPNSSRIALDRLAELVDLAVGEAGRRLVQQQERGLRRQRPGDLEALQRAERQAGRRAEGEVRRGRGARAARRRSSRVRPLLVPGRRCAARPRTKPTVPWLWAPDHHVLEQRHRREQRQVLERAGDAELGDAVRRQRRAGRARRTMHPAPRRLVDAADDVEHRRLAGAVRPDEPADLALVDGERQPVERDDAAEAHRDVAHVEQRSTAAASVGPPGRSSRSASPWCSMQKRAAGCGLQPLVADGAAAGLARAVGALVEALHRPFDVGDLGLDLLEDREVLLPLEGLGADVGIVLAEVGQLAGRTRRRTRRAGAPRRSRPAAARAGRARREVLACGSGLHRLRKVLPCHDPCVRVLAGRKAS